MNFEKILKFEPAKQLFTHESNDIEGDTTKIQIHTKFNLINFK